jgi:hypothetical protein
MGMMTKFLTASALAAAMTAGAAQAATLSFTGVAGSTKTLSNNFFGFDGQTIDFISGDVKSALNGLSVSGPAKVTFTFLGWEASNTNYSAQTSGGLFTNAVDAAGDTKQAISLGGLIDFFFGTTKPDSAVGVIANNGVASPASKDYAIGYSAIFNGGKSIFVFFDDIASGDRDFDDSGMRIDVAAVPVPAAGFLLIGALGGLVTLRRRKTA